MPNEKIYFLAKAFRETWMNSQSFCRSFGMDLVALESQHEADYFHKSCDRNVEEFEEVSHIGGVSDGHDWYWLASQSKVNFDLKLDESESEKNCLQMVKVADHFSYTGVSCVDGSTRGFVCQKLIKKIDHRWSLIFGR
jgi:Lectin C-type domain